ncbi:hypothetical protein SETIT_2G266100v2 [Setaria italica]|uniref:Auxin efflux carrier component n=1 Tax=Setaria italica TaxID=4555 RepID=A0A368Q3D9_SETIT|nr:hypothetical protein SETIT_2G266100v2 [Setaria italica]
MQLMSTLTGTHAYYSGRLVIYFSFPFFGFDLTGRPGSFAASYRVLAADVACKALVVLALAGWAAASRWSSGKRGGGSCSYLWCITGFSLAALNNALLMGFPLLDAMYGAWAHDIAVQMSMMQIVVWFPLMLVVFEARQAWLEMPLPVPAVVAPADGGGAVEEEEGGHATAADLDGDGEESGDGRKATVAAGWRSFWAPLLRTVALKLAFNPNAYASLLGLAWSSIANRWHLELPSIVEGSVTIIFTALSLVLRFVAGPAAGASVLGLRGDLVRFAIGRIIIGKLVSLPVLIAYYLVLAS